MKQGAGLQRYVFIWRNRQAERGRGAHRLPALADMLGEALQRVLQNGNRDDAIAFVDGEAFLRIIGIESIRELQEKAAETGERPGYGIVILHGK